MCHPCQQEKALFGMQFVIVQMEAKEAAIKLGEYVYIYRTETGFTYLPESKALADGHPDPFAIVSNLQPVTV